MISTGSAPCGSAFCSVSVGISCPTVSTCLPFTVPVKKAIAPKVSAKFFISVTPLFFANDSQGPRSFCISPFFSPGLRAHSASRDLSLRRRNRTPGCYGRRRTTSGYSASFELEPKDYARGYPGVLFVGLSSGSEQQPVALNESPRDALVQVHVEPAAGRHGKAVLRDSAARSNRPANQDMGKWRYAFGFAVGKHRPCHRRVKLSAVLVGAAEIGCYTEPVVHVSCDGCIPTVRINVRIEMRELIAAVDFPAGVILRCGRQTTNHRKHQCCKDLSHGILRLFLSFWY